MMPTGIGGAGLAVDRKKDFVAGRRFAYRERARSSGTPVRPVEFVKNGPPLSNKAQIRWLDGEYEGLEEWIPAVRLVVPWEEAEAFLQDERREMEALEASEGALSRAEWEAVVEVIFNLVDVVPPPPGERERVDIDISTHEEGLLHMRSFEETVPELGLEPKVLLAEPYAYIDRFGTYNAPLQTALWVAKHCCRRFGQHFFRKVRATEDALQVAAATGYYTPPGFPQLTQRMRIEQVVAEWHAREPVFALVREWCGRPPAEPLDFARGAAEEVERLGSIIEETAAWLRRKKYYKKANELLRELGERPRKPRPLTLEQMAAKMQKQIEETRDSL
jgi:hypothetical protein